MLQGEQLVLDAVQLEVAEPTECVLGLEDALGCGRWEGSGVGESDGYADADAGGVGGVGDSGWMGAADSSDASS